MELFYLHVIPFNVISMRNYALRHASPKSFCESALTLLSSPSASHNKLHVSEGIFLNFTRRLMHTRW
jgi:hypothetical protein